MSSSLQTVEIETAPHPAAAVIWLHGLGADANDFVPLVPELDLRDAAGKTLAVRFVFPNAPVMPVTINGGMRMRAWYDILHADLGAAGGEQSVPREDEVGLRASLIAVDALVATQIARGIPASRIVLAGFSQGAAMTLLSGLRHRERLAGLVVLSGYLPLAATTVAERNAAHADVPIFMAHGTQDPVVRFERAVASRDALLALGYRVQWQAYPMPHSVCTEEVGAIAAFLRSVLAQV